MADDVSSEVDKKTRAKLRPKAEGEFIEIDLGGQPTKIPRGDMSDKAWADLKARAQGSIVKVIPSEVSYDQEQEDGDKTMKSKPVDWPQLLSHAQNLEQVSDSVLSKEEKRLIQKVPSEWDRAEFIRLRLKNKGYDVPPNSADDEKASYKAPSAPVQSNGVTKPEQGSPDEWQQMPTKSPAGSGTQTEDAAPVVGSADPGMSVRGQMARLATGGLPEIGNIIPTKAKKLEKVRNDAADAVGAMKSDEIAHQKLADAPLDAQINAAAAVRDMNAQAAANTPGSIESRRKLYGDRMGTVAAQEGGPEAPGILDTINNEATGVRNAIVDTALDPAGALGDVVPTLARGAGEMLAAGGPLGDIPTAPNEQQLAAREDMTLPPPGAPPAPPEVPGQGVPPAGSGSLAASIRVPGGVNLQKVDPALEKQALADQEKARQGVSDAQDQIAALGIAQDGAMRQAAQAHTAAMAEAEKHAQLAAQAQLNAVQEARRYETARLAVVNEATKAASNPLDPNRYWNNKSAGQQAAAIVAGALFGFTGQGMDWLKRIDSLVEQDLRTQASDRQMKVEGLNAKAASLGRAGDEALKHGATMAEAYNIARQAKYAELKSFLDMTAMKMSNMQQKQQALQMSTQLDMKIAALSQEGLQQASINTHQRNMEMLQNAQLAQGAAKIQIAAAAKATGGKGRAVSPSLAARVANTKQLISTLQQMKDLAKNSGFIDRMGRNVKESVDSTEAGKLDQYRAKQFEVARLRAGSSLQKPEQEALLPLLRERSGRFDPVPGLDEAIKSAQKALDIELKNTAEATAGTVEGDGEGAAPEFPEEPADE